MKTATSGTFDEGNLHQRSQKLWELCASLWSIPESIFFSATSAAFGPKWALWNYCELQSIPPPGCSKNRQQDQPQSCCRVTPLPLHSQTLLMMASIRHRARMNRKPEDTCKKWLLQYHSAKANLIRWLFLEDRDRKEILREQNIAIILRGCGDPWCWKEIRQHSWTPSQKVMCASFGAIGVNFFIPFHYKGAAEDTDWISPQAHIMPVQQGLFRSTAKANPTG